MPSEMPPTSRVRKVCQACGTKLAVVRMAAAVPMASMSIMGRVGRLVRGTGVDCTEEGVRPTRNDTPTGFPFIRMSSMAAMLALVAICCTTLCSST